MKERDLSQEIEMTDETKQTVIKSNESKKIEIPSFDFAILKDCQIQLPKHKTSCFTSYIKIDLTPFPDTSLTKFPEFPHIEKVIAQTLKKHESIKYTVTNTEQKTPSIGQFFSSRHKDKQIQNDLKKLTGSTFWQPEKPAKGVQIQPNLRFIAPDDPQHSYLIESVFASSDHQSIDSETLFTNDDSGSTGGTSGGGSGSSGGDGDSFDGESKTFTRKEITKGFQDHHIISHTNKATKDHEEMEYVDLDSRANKIFLPEDESLHSTRSVHSGRHTQAYSDYVEEKLNKLSEQGEAEKWGPERHKEEVTKLQSELRQELRHGNIALNKNKRSWSDTPYGAS